jgi:plastocyanin
MRTRAIEMRTRAIMVWSGFALLSGIACCSVINGKVECKDPHDGCDAVVYLANVPGTFKASGDSPLMDQYRMEFTPHILPILVGTTVRIRNSDPTMHNVYTPSKAGDFFNLGTWAKGLIKTFTFKQPGEVRLLCNVHPRMEAWILVFSNPWFAKTGSDGGYSLRDVPPGRYELRVWHEKLEFAPMQVQVPSGGEVAINVTSQ